VQFKLGSVGEWESASCSYQLKTNLKTIAIVFSSLRLVSGRDLLVRPMRFSHGGSLGLRRFSIDSVELRMVGVTEWRTVKQGCQTHSRIRGEQRYL